MKTVLITGCSSGYGLETARHFLAQGWRVIASMRTPRAGSCRAASACGCWLWTSTSAESIAAAIEAAGPIDVLVNNAGIGVVGALEATPMSKTRQVFETNTFGVIAMTRPSCRSSANACPGVIRERDLERDAGADAPGLGLHGQQDGHRGLHRLARARAAGLQGARQAGRARLWPDDAFRQNTDLRLEDVIPEPYAPFAQPILAAFAKPQLVTTEADVAEASSAPRSTSPGGCGSRPAPTHWRWSGSVGPAGEFLVAGPFDGPFLG